MPKFHFAIPGRENDLQAPQSQRLLRGMSASIRKDFRENLKVECVRVHITYVMSCFLKENMFLLDET